MVDLKNLLPLIKCPDCERSDVVVSAQDGLRCTACQRVFAADGGGILRMLPAKKRQAPAAYADPDYLKWQEIFPQVFASRGAVQKFIDDSTHRWIAGAFSRHALGHDDWVADLGCGTGDHFIYFGTRGNTIGLDINEAPLSACRQRDGQMTLIQADIGCLPFKDESLGHVFVLHVLEHIHHLEETLKEIERVVKKEGLVYVGLPCEGGWLRDTLRALIIVKRNSRRYGIDYAKVARIEHCHSAREVMDRLRERFRITRVNYFPFGCTTPHINLTVSMELRKAPFE